MTVVINEKKFDRFWTIVAGSLCLLALVLTIVALRTSSWTVNEYSATGEVQRHGLFNKCNEKTCTWNEKSNFLVILASLIGALALLLSTIFIFLMGVHSFPRRHFYLTPAMAFLGVLLLLVALSLYALQSLVNGISARLVITALVLALTSFTIVVYIAGRYSIFYKENPIEFSYRKTETTETAKGFDEQQADER